MRFRILLTFAFLAQATVTLPATEPSQIPADIKEIGENVVSILTNGCKMLGGFSKILTKGIKLGTRITSGFASFGAKYQKTSFTLAAVLATYLSWRCYDYCTFEKQMQEAAYFLSPILPVSDGTQTPQTAQLKIANLQLDNAFQQTIEGYLDRIETLKQGLRDYSLLAQWFPENANNGDWPNIEGVTRVNFYNMDQDFTADNITDIENYIKPRIACLGMPKLYPMSHAHWVWGKRLRAPFTVHAFDIASFESWDQCAREVFHSYFWGSINTYEGIATELTWQLFKWEKKLRARLHELQ